MADYVSTIELKAMTGDLQRKLSKVNSSLKGVSRQVEKTQGAFKRMTVKATSSFSKLDAAVERHKGKILGLAASVGVLATAGVVAFKKWEEGLAQIETLGVTGISKVSEELKKLRREYGITGAEATKGYYDIISAGAKQGAEALDRMTAATKLAVAGNTDLAGAVDIVTSTINLFGKQGETATSIVDKIFLAVKYGKTTVQELGQAWGFVAPVAAAAGLSLDELAAAMAGVTAGGIKTKQATTGMKAVISNIAKVTPKAAAAAKAAGIEFNLQALHTKGLVGVMRDLQKATGGSIEELLKFFESTEAAGAVAALLSNLDAMEATTNAMADSFGTVDEALKKVQATFGNRWDIFSAQMSIASETIGGALVPSLTAMLEVLGPIVDFVAAIILQHPGIVKVTVAVTAFAAAWALLGGKAAIVLTGVVYVLTKIAKHFDLFAEGGAHAFNVVTAAWHNFVLGIKQSRIGKIFMNLWDSISLPTFKQAVDGISSWINDMRIDAVVAWDSFTIWWDKLDLKSITWLDVKTGVIEWFDNLIVSGKAAWASFKVWWEGLTIFGIDVSQAFDDLIDSVVSGFETLKTKAVAGWEIFKTWWVGLTIFGINVSEVFTDLADWFVAGFISLKASAVTAWSTFKEWWVGLTIGGINVSQVFSDLVDWFVDGFISLKASAATAWDSFKVWWEGLTIAGIDVSELFTKVTDYVVSGFVTLKAKAVTAWDTFKVWWEGLELFGIDVSELFVEITDYIVAGFVALKTSAITAWYTFKAWWEDLELFGIDVSAVFSEFIDSIVAIFTSAKASGIAAWDTFKVWWVGLEIGTINVSSIFTDLGTAISNGFTAVKATAVTAWDAFTGWWNTLEIAGIDVSAMFTGVYDSAVQAFDDTVAYIKDIPWVSSIFSGINTAIETVKDWFYDLWVYLVGSSIIPMLINDINTWFGKLDFVSTIESMVEKAKALFADLFDAVTGASTSTGDLLPDAERDFGTLNTIVAAVTTAVNGFQGAISQIDLSRLQKAIQTSRNLEASISDDLGKSFSTDKATSSRAFENAGAGRTSLRAEQIKAYRSLGQEIGMSMQKGVNAEMDKMIKNLEGKLKTRGFMSRFFFGAGTQLTWAEKFIGLMSRINLAFTKTLGGINKLAGSLDKVIEKLAKIKTTTSGLGADGKRLGNTFEKGGAGKSVPISPETTVKQIKIPKIQAATTLLQKLAVTVANLVARVGAYTAATVGFLGKIPGISALTAATGSAAKMLTQGRIFRSIKFIAGKILIPLVAAYDAFKGFTDLGRISEITGLDTSGIQDAEKNLLAAELALETMAEGTRVYSDQQGKITSLAAALEQAEGDSGLTTGVRAISAASNAIGNFISGFAWLGGIIAGWVGLEKTAAVLEEVDFAPTIRKLFDILGNLGKTIGNIVGIFTGGDGDGFIDGTIAAAFSIVINTIVGVIDVINKIAIGLEALSRGDLGGFITTFQRVFDTLINYIKGIIPGGDSFDELQEEDQRRYASEDTIKTQERAEEEVSKYTDALAFLEEGTKKYEATQVLAVKAQEELNVAARNAAAALENFKLDGATTGSITETMGAQRAEKAAEKAALTSTVGEIKPSRFATGGPIAGPGTGVSDSIPAMLSNGEYVINAKSAAQNRALLEAINSGKIKGYAEGGAVEGQRYDFVQSQTQGTGNLLEETVIDWVNVFESTVGTLERGSDAFKKLNRLFEDARDNTTNMNYEQAKSEGVIKDFNKGVIEAGIGVTAFDEATAGAAGAITATAEDIAAAGKTVAKNDWEGTFSSFTDPLKRAALEGGNFADALKEGARNLFQNIAGKLMDRAMKPLEDAMDMIFDDMFGSTSGNDGSTAANAMYVQITEGLGGIFSQSNDAANATTKAVLAGTEATNNVFTDSFSSLGSILHGGGSGSSGILGGLMGGSTGSSAGGGIFGFLGSLFGFSKGGIVPKPGMQPQYFASGGMAKGTDTVPAMLTPGEMVLNKDQQDMLGGSNTYNTYNLDISGNVDQRAIEQIRNIIQNSPNQVNQASNRGERERTGLRQSNRR